MYDPASNYLGTFNDASVGWGVSAPHDPGRTHIFYSGDPTGVREVIVELDHATWRPPLFAYNAGGSWDAYGMWVSPDLSVIFQACVSGMNTGVTKWNRQPDGTYVRDVSWASTIGAAVDVDVNGLGWPTEFLWVTRNVAYGTTAKAINKVNAVTGIPYDENYGIVTWALMCCADGVGNVAVTFGKSTPTWAQRYWGLFAEPGITTAEKTTQICYQDCDPIIVPGSVDWTPDNTIAADGVDSASVTFKVWDCNWWDDITDCCVDLRPLGHQVRCVSVEPDPSDPSGLIGIVRVNDIQAAPGARCTTSPGQLPHYLTVTMTDSGPNTTTVDDQSLEFNVSGHPFSARIRHRRVADWYVEGAQIVAIGGGIPGASDPRAAGPFVYRSAPRTDTLTLRNQWYVCDPDDPANGMLCLITKPDEMFPFQWDCPTGADILGNPTYIGERPAQGDTTMITGVLDVPCGHESRVLIQDADVIAAMTDLSPTIDRVYKNLGDIGGYPSEPIIVPLSAVSHPGTTAFSETWGKYVQVNDVVVIEVHPVGDDNPSGEPVPYVVVADMQGNTAEIVFQTPQTLGITSLPSIGCTYSFRGAAGRRNRYGEGCIRVRAASDVISSPDNCIVGPFDDLGSVRGLPDGSCVSVAGIVTAKVAGSIWIESPSRSSSLPCL